LLRDRRSCVLILLAGAGILVLVYQFGLARFLDMVVYSSSVGGWDGRLEIWVRAVNLVRDYPFSGIGMGSFQVMAETFYAYDIYAPEHIPHAHNLFMQVSLDVGLPGMIAWLAIFITIFTLSWQIYQAGQKSEDSIYLSTGAALIASQTALAVHGLTDAVTWGMVRPAPLVWIIWGVGAAVISLIVKLQEKT
jgi:putative inorganic carbon (HCO3(-)) transporter